MKVLVDKLNKKKLEITGAIDELEVVNYENDKITTIEKITLPN